MNVIIENVLNISQFVSYPRNILDLIIPNRLTNYQKFKLKAKYIHFVFSPAVSVPHIEINLDQVDISKESR